jgi:predicted esterase
MPDPIEGHIEVARSARFWVCGAEGEPVRERWYVLHGYRQLAERFLRRFHSVCGGGREVVAPEGLNRFYIGADRGRHGAGAVVGASWMTREDRDAEIRDYVRYLDALADGFPTDDAPVTVLGFSQGVATACRWVTYGRMRPERLVLWGDFLPPDLDLDAAREALSGTEIVLVRGSEDPALADAELRAAEAERMEAAGLELRVVRYEGGHDIDGPTLRALAADRP